VNPVVGGEDRDDRWFRDRRRAGPGQSSELNGKILEYA
jgi:hypothetical protein